MKLNWRSWKVGAALGSFVPLSVCAGYVFYRPDLQWPLVAAMIVSTVSILLLLAWATCRTTGWKMWAAIGMAFLPWVACVYWAFFAPQQIEYCGCVAPPKYTPSEMSQLKEKAEKGDAEEQYRLGAAYKGGWYQGGTVDYSKAVNWYRKSAEQGNAPAQVALGDMYDQGNGVKTDYAEAAKWFLKAAHQGNSDAQFRLSLRYRWGQGVKQDYAEALFWDAVFVGDLWSDDRYSDKHLTAEQIATVKKRVQAWKKVNPAPAATPTGK